MKFNSTVSSLFNVEDQYNTLLEKMSTQKSINRPSDDPVGVTRLIDIKQHKAAITQYTTNADSAQSWVNMTESKLSSASDLIVRAKQLATSQASATATAATRQVTSSDVQGIADQMLSLANSQMNGRYLFSGTSSTEPFSATQMSAAIGTAQSSTDNVFDGMVASSGTYTGNQNKSYVVKITSGGTLAAAKYVVSSDGGKTWGSEQTGLSAPVSVGDGITLTFTSGTKDLAANDAFSVNGTTAGYYKGNGDNLSVRIGQSTILNYNISGEQAFTDKGQGTVDILKTLNDLKTAMANNDVAGISQQLDNLDKAQKSLSLSTSLCGTKTNQVDITKTNLTDLDNSLTSIQSNTEDADITQLATQFSMKQIALEASYAMAGKISQNTILNYIK